MSAFTDEEVITIKRRVWRIERTVNSIKNLFIGNIVLLTIVCILFVVTILIK